MTQLWYEIKKLGRMEIKKDCALCQGTLRRLKSHPLKKDQAIVIIPDVNVFGNIMGYHIGRTTWDKIRGVAVVQDVMEEQNERDD